MLTNYSTRIIIVVFDEKTPGYSERCKLIACASVFGSYFSISFRNDVVTDAALSRVLACNRHSSLVSCGA